MQESPSATWSDQPTEVVARERPRIGHVVLGAVLGARMVGGHLALPLMVTVRGLPFLGLLLLKPGEPTAILAGAQVRDGRLPLAAAIVAAAVGAVVADALGYLAGRLWGEVAITRLSRHGGRRTARMLERANRLIVERGPLAVIAARPTVVTHGVMPVIAGTAGMSWARFFPSAAAGAILWAVTWVAGGVGIGAGWAELPAGARLALASGVALAAVVYAGLCLLRRSCPQPRREPVAA